MSERPPAHEQSMNTGAHGRIRRCTAPMVRVMGTTATGTRVDTARMLARSVLAALADRWQHTTGVAERAEELAVTVHPSERDLLVSAAWLHDIGYGAMARDTGFHALDGALFLERLGWPGRSCALVAHHSGAWFVACAQGLQHALDRFVREQSPVSDALAYADQTTGPVGQRLPIRQRMAEAVARHGADSPQARVVHLRQDHLIAVADRVQRRLLAALQPAAGGHGP